MSLRSTLSSNKVTELAEQYNDVATLFSEAVGDNNNDGNAAYFSFFESSLEGKFVLDLGCGTGYDLQKMKKSGANIYGIDAAQKMVEIAQLNNPNANIQVARFDEKLPFADHFFDFVISKWALQNALDMDPVYEEIARVLKINGQLIYLAGHPHCQFALKKGDGKNYFDQEIVEATFWDGKVSIKEPSNNLNHYLSDTFLRKFSLLAFREGHDRSGGKIKGDILPNYLIIKARRMPD